MVLLQVSICTTPVHGTSCVESDPLFKTWLNKAFLCASKHVWVWESMCASHGCGQCSASRQTQLFVWKHSNGCPLRLECTVCRCSHAQVHHSGTHSSPDLYTPDIQRLVQSAYSQKGSIQSEMLAHSSAPSCNMHQDLLSPQLPQDLRNQRRRRISWLLHWNEINNDINHWSWTMCRGIALHAGDEWYSLVF